ncbi:VWA domain-containing protein [Luteolibacter pohnpeiensis]|uniref:VWA domain-containing protein n=1 Tax=Luteolibacter pohnpeiensis TaxID=454153 RepID=A0A934S230_9BACT|nr:VWA domain-containing protein [Luteolibacter pohnpeiensis]MBK1880922.1 VWA domain-containing protein [Luteolibacter pohnpeiensis]
MTISAIAGPTWKKKPDSFAGDESPLMILLKADRSMEVADPAPCRIERAKLKIKDLARARKGQPLGLIVYAGSAHLVLPPTKDTSVVAEMAAEISPDILPSAGDRLDLAITLAGEISPGGTLLILSDGLNQDDGLAAKAFEKAGSPKTQILAVTSTLSESFYSLRKSIHADLFEMSSDDADIEQIIKSSKHATIADVEQNKEQWQEAGYYLTPIICAFALLPFRRETSAQITE